MGARVQKIAETKMVPRRPKYLFRGSEHQQPLESHVRSASTDQLLCQSDLHESRCNVRRSVDQTLEPLVPGCVWVILQRNAEGIREGQVGTVRTSLIPALNGGTDGTQDDGEVQASGLSPFVQNLISDSVGLDLGHTGDLFECWRVLGDQGTLDKELSDVSKIVLASEEFDVGDNLGLGHASQRVLDLSARAVAEVDCSGSMRLLLISTGGHGVSTESTCDKQRQAEVDVLDALLAILVLIVLHGFDCYPECALKQAL